MIFSMAIRRSCPVSVLRLYSPKTAVHNAGRGRSKISLQNKCIFFHSEMKSRLSFKTIRNKQFYYYLFIQCAAEITHELSTNTPPHQCPRKPYNGCNTSNDTCHGNSPSDEIEPPTIRPDRLLL